MSAGRNVRVLRHAAVLALSVLTGCVAGESTGPTGWSIVTPQTKYALFGSGIAPYPSKEFCEKRLEFLRRQNQREGSPPGADPGLPMAQCVSTDDPRLKGN